MAGAGGHESKRLMARVFNSGFPQGHSAFNGMLGASDGKIYYVLCTDSLDTGAQMFSYDPATGKIAHVGDLTEASGEKGLKAIPQGKSHVNFVESNGKLYFSTHLGYYSIQGGMEKSGVAPAGYKPYPGGHFLAYDMASGRFENLATAPPGEGIITMNMDWKRGRLYGLTWPSGIFLRYDLATRNLKNLGPTSKQGEAGTGQTYRTICRSLAVDPEDGSVYMTTSDGDILRYRYDRDAIETVQGVDLRKDYFGTFDPSKPGHMGYNWRQTVWDPAERAIYGVHGNSGYLFRFDPRVPRVDVLERITSEPSRRSGMFDKFPYGYLGFTLGPDGHTLYYLTGGAIYESGMLVAANRNTAGEEDVHLVTYDIPSTKYIDHGPIFFPNGQRPADVNSIAVAKDGTVYSLSVVHENGKQRADLISIKPD
jgi:outer membrane protein assembly factor BamB